MLRLRTPLLFTVILLTALRASPAFSVEGPGSRPMNVAISPDEKTVIATSMGSTKVTQARYSTGTGVWTVSYIEVDAPSWGVAFVDLKTVVLTHPGEAALSVLTRTLVASDFTKNREIQAPYYSTEVIAKPSTRKIFVANRGTPLSGQDEWTHSVLQYDLLTDALVGTAVTEREPRALALSPDGGRLFVGNVQGALGDDPLVSNHTVPPSQTGYLGDGGSILVYDMSWSGSEMPLNGERIGVGSPVRGIATSGNSDGSYVVYFTSVGDNANSEDPEESPDFFGGQDIPNIITALVYSSSHVLQSLDRGVFNHKPEWTPTQSFDPVPAEGLPAVLPDKLVVRDYVSGGQRKRELFVVNSGSGTLSRTPLTPTGALQTNGIRPVKMIRLFSNLTIEPLSDTNLPVLLALTDQSGTNVSHLDLSRDPQDLSRRFTSSARAIAYSKNLDKVWVATQFDNQLIQVAASDNLMEIAELFDIADPVGSLPERHFFGFGRGFHFREMDDPAVPNDGQPTVGNQTCATCHVDGHSDGKVRLTRRQSGNKKSGTDAFKPVAVPSCFDVGRTEWIFFEGLRTILDGQFGEDTACNYCDGAGFFDDTEAFTNELASPRSPHNWAGTLSGTALQGRYIFEALNCSRCHMGPIPGFIRSEEGDVGQGGPIGEGLSTFNPFLHDPTQVFISSDLGSGAEGDDSVDLSLRNMTDVGTRASADAQKPGVNTPALAGLWDNRPYMHDGRYRTIDEVLEHTWLKAADALRAAPFAAADTLPNNAFKNKSITVLEVIGTRALTKFGTHGPIPPDPTGWSPVSTALSQADYDALKDFVFSLSSQTDPCSGGAPDYVRDLTANGATVSWTSPVNVQCKVIWDGPTPFEQTTTSTSSTHPNPAPGTYTVHMDPLVRPLCGLPDRDTIQVEIGPSLLAGGEDVPAMTEMSAGRPNPFNPTTTIAFSLAANARVSVVVYDTSGRSVRTLVNEDRKSGRYSLVWDGRDSRGAPVASGVYFCKMIAGSYQSTQKLVLLK